MARVTCAISGIRLEISGFSSLSLPHTVGYYHPIFTLPEKKLYQYYIDHCHGRLQSVDSYLLFLALLNSSGKITWEHPSVCDPNESRTKMLVQNNIAQLVRILEKTSVIKHPMFKQPSFRLTYDNSHLDQIPNWIKAWENNLTEFNNNRASIRIRQTIAEIERKLSEVVIYGEDPEKYAHLVAEWACQASDFPPDKKDLWKATIRSCYNSMKMLNTDSELLLEIKDYCECNLEAGSLYFHTLCNTLREGLSRKTNHLGGGFSTTDFELAPKLGSKESIEAWKREQLANEQLLNLAMNADAEEPKEHSYPNKLTFLKAKLAYRVAKNIAKKEAVEARAKIAREKIESMRSNKPEDNL